MVRSGEGLMDGWCGGSIRGAVVCAEDEGECARDELVVLEMGLGEVGVMRWADKIYVEWMDE